jgi:hypothetical protein
MLLFKLSETGLTKAPEDFAHGQAFGFLDFLSRSRNGY